MNWEPYKNTIYQNLEMDRFFKIKIQNVDFGKICELYNQLTIISNFCSHTDNDNPEIYFDQLESKIKQRQEIVKKIEFDSSIDTSIRLLKEAKNESDRETRLSNFNLIKLCMENNIGNIECLNELDEFKFEFESYSLNVKKDSLLSDQIKSLTRELYRAMGIGKYEENKYQIPDAEIEGLHDYTTEILSYKTDKAKANVLIKRNVYKTILELNETENPKKIFSLIESLPEFKKNQTVNSKELEIKYKEFHSYAKKLHEQFAPPSMGIIENFERNKINIHSSTKIYELAENILSRYAQTCITT